MGDSLKLAAMFVQYQDSYTCVTLFTEHTDMAFDVWQLVQAELFSMMDVTSLGVLTCNSSLRNLKGMAQETENSS